MSSGCLNDIANLTIAWKWLFISDTKQQIQINKRAKNRILTQWFVQTREAQTNERLYQGKYYEWCSVLFRFLTRNEATVSMNSATIFVNGSWSLQNFINCDK